MGTGVRTSGLQNFSFIVVPSGPRRMPPSEDVLIYLGKEWMNLSFLGDSTSRNNNMLCSTIKQNSQCWQVGNTNADEYKYAQVTREEIMRVRDISHKRKIK